MKNYLLEENGYFPLLQAIPSLLLLAQILDPDVAKLYRRSVTEKADMSAIPKQARVLLMIGRSIFLKRCDVTIQNYRTIEDHLNFRTFYYYFFVIPLPYRFQETALGRNCSVDRTMILVHMQVFINRSLVVENLQLHTYVGRITLQRSTDSQSIISTRCQLKLKTIYEIAKLFFGVQIATRTFTWHWLNGDVSVFNDIIRQVACPVVHIGTVK